MAPTLVWCWLIVAGLAVTQAADLLPSAVDMYVGCYTDTAVRDLPEHILILPNNTPKNCIIHCRYMGWEYAGVQAGAWCLCGKSYGRFGTSNNCNTACNGDALIMCGGPWTNAIYKTGFDYSSPAVASSYIGCYKDNGYRDLPQYYYTGATTTPNQCIAHCLDKHMQYASLQASSWCFCGWSYGLFGTATTCTMGCTGDGSKICGGAWTNSVYNTGANLPANPTADAYVGCYADTGVRDLPEAYLVLTANTPLACIQHCREKRWEYAALQAGAWCFCGSSYGRFGKSDNCVSACTGDGELRCGGGWANQIYKTGLDLSAAPGPSSYIGCYGDGGNRDLGETYINMVDTTPDKCIAYCRSKHAKYAGMQYSTWCFCGFSYGLYGNVGTCNTPCVGDRSQMCGGAWTNSVYDTGIELNPIAGDATGNYVGCYKDQAVRDLTELIGTLSDNTPRNCIQHCLDKKFPYAGVQYGAWCLCGMTYGRYGTTNACNSPCNGDSSMICGGAWTNSVYKTGAVIPPCSSSPCKNGGACTDASATTFVCQCGVGWTGNDCSIVNPCGSKPCKNGGVCTPKTSTTFTCACAVGWTGADCATADPCATSPCQNGGVCTATGSITFTCACPTGWRGADCSIIDDPCASNPCKNGGACTKTGGTTFTCKCVAGWQGTDCTTEVNVCAISNPCKNGGTCVKFGNYYECSCPQTWAGDNCEMSSATCTTVAPESRYNCGWSNISPTDCNKRSCCYDESVSNRPWCFYSSHNCDAISMDTRTNCGFDGISYVQCINRGCCYDDDPTTNPGAICFMKANPACVGVKAVDRKAAGSADIQPNQCVGSGWCYDSSATPNCFTRA